MELSGFGCHLEESYETHKHKNGLLHTNTIKVPFLHFPSIPITAELERSFDVFTTHEENEGDFFVC